MHGAQRRIQYYVIMILNSVVENEIKFHNHLDQFITYILVLNLFI